MGKSQELYKKAKTFIPGGTQLLSKRPEMFLPDFWPAYYSKTKGCQVWDLDGEKYIDASYMGIGACSLGYADPDVNKAVALAVKKGSMCTLNAPEEVELAELLVKLHPWAGMVRYTKGGGDAMTVAVRIARAKTGKDKVLFCGYHGWHDWYLSANLADDKALDGHLLKGLYPNGVPRALKGSSIPFLFNNIKAFMELIHAHKGEVGAVVLESIRNEEPTPEFIKTLREVTREEGIVLIVDEITAGFRLNQGGAHMLYGPEPDIAVFGKSISNGFAMGAVLGKTEVMEAAQESFISSTYWTERLGPTAALATIHKMLKYKVTDHLVKVGRTVKDGWKTLLNNYQLGDDIGGIDPLGHFAFKHEKPLVLKTLFTQWMLEEGFLATTAFYACYAHQEKHISSYLNSADKVMKKIKVAVDSGNPEKFLKGKVCHSGFQRLN